MFDSTTLRQLLQLVAGVVMVLGLVTAMLIQTRLLKKDTVNWGFDRRAIQFVTMVLIVPLILEVISI
jgi:hypothetical protein